MKEERLKKEKQDMLGFYDYLHTSVSLFPYLE